MVQWEQERSNSSNNYDQSQLRGFRLKWCDPCLQWPQAHKIILAAHSPLTKSSWQLIVQAKWQQILWKNVLLCWVANPSMVTISDSRIIFSLVANPPLPLIEIYCIQRIILLLFVALVYRMILLYLTTRSQGSGPLRRWLQETGSIHHTGPPWDAPLYEACKGG